MRGGVYRLRMTIFEDTTEVYDSSWQFTHNGYVTQNDAPATGLGTRTWELSDQQTCLDTTGIVWDNQEEVTAHFWLPFTPGVTGSVVTGCYSYEISTSGCYKGTDSNRRWGNAGIIGLSRDMNDPSFGYAPVMMYNNMFYDHQSSGFRYAVNSTLTRMTLVYRLAMIRAAPPSAPFPPPSPPLPPPSPPPPPLPPPPPSPPPLQYCRAEQNWTIAAKFSQGYYVKNVPVNYYNAYFRDNVWIKGASEGAPTNTTPSYRTASPYFAVESIDWESYLVRSRVIVTFSTNPIPLRTS